MTAPGTKLRRGGWRWIAGHRYARVRVGKRQRETVALSGCTTDIEANERATQIGQLASALVAAGRPDKVKDLASSLGAARTEAAIADVFKAAAHVGAASEDFTPGVETFQDFATLWTSGELAREFPDHVKVKATAREDRNTLKQWVYPVSGPVPLRTFQLEDAEKVMRGLPRELSSARRRHVAQVMHRVLALAVYPAKRIAASPLPRGFLPKLGKPRAKSFLYPKEDAKLLACKDVPLASRVFYGVLTREGPRPSELAGGEEQGREILPLDWEDVDLDLGVFRLDENKTNDPRAWAMSPGVKEALAAWKKIQKPKSEKSPIFPRGTIAKNRAQALQAHLVIAGVSRAELSETTEQRLALRAHDLRGTFVTLSLANGKSETWVMDRTGHKTSDMINRYRRAARTAEELGLGELLRLDVAIPELAAQAASGATRKTERRVKTGATVGAKRAVNRPRSKGQRNR